MLIAFNKPYGVICQFSPSGEKPTLKDYINTPNIYPAGRLDTDSEGLMLLTDDGILQARIADPRQKLKKTYWAEVEGLATDAALAPLLRGVDLGDFRAAPAHIARAIPTPALWPRNPPVRFRASIPTSWIEISISEGKNRQVRRMTANVGLPTLRLVRVAIGSVSLSTLGTQGLGTGEFMQIAPSDLGLEIKRSRPKTPKNR
jgi:23S rRNA pseudouridine2457 synthase